MVRIRMRPILVVALPQFLLLRSQQRPIMNCLRLLDHADKRRGLAFALFLADFGHFSQAAAKVVAPVAKIELGADIDHVAALQFRNMASGASILNLAEAFFAAAG